MDENEYTYYEYKAFPGEELLRRNTKTGFIEVFYRGVAPEEGWMDSAWNVASMAYPENEEHDIRLNQDMVEVTYEG